MFTLFPPKKESLSKQGRRDMPTSRAGSSKAGSVRERSLSPIRSHRRVPTANDFPVPGDYQPFAVKVRDQGLVSPAASSFSFTDNETLPPVHAFTPPSPTLSLSHAVSTPRNDFEKDIMLQTISRGVHEDGLPMSTPTRTPQEREIARKKSMYYQEVFALREPNLTPTDRVHNTSVITVEVKTNVIVRESLHSFAIYLLTGNVNLRSGTSISFSTSFHNICRSATNGQPHLSLSLSITPLASCSQAPSILLTFLPSMLFLRSSNLQATKGIRP